MSTTSTTESGARAEKIKDFTCEIGADGRFVRTPSSFRKRVTRDGSSGYKAEAGRYHIYYATACPWSSRVMITIMLKGLQDVFTFSQVAPTMVPIGDGARGWGFDETHKDDLFGTATLKDVYMHACPYYVGKFTVPVLYDKKTNTIVNNESEDIMRMLYTEFEEFVAPNTRPLDLYPKDLRQQINEVNEWMYHQINNGVYRCGFAASQIAYDEAVEELFEGLDRIEAILSSNRYVCGDRFTEADIRLYVTMIRFESVYAIHFKCAKKRFSEYVHINGWLREVFQNPLVASVTLLDEIKKHYYTSHKNINPLGIVPKTPDLRLNEPHGRQHLPAKQLL